jgi:hypothetical protein
MQNKDLIRLHEELAGSRKSSRFQHIFDRASDAESRNGTAISNNNRLSETLDHEAASDSHNYQKEIFSLNIGINYLKD